MASRSLLLLAALLGLGMCVSVAGADWGPKLPGEVRCFCNLSVCVTGGYMCKSTKGGCFSDLFDFRDVYKARHGCVELLDKERQGQCQNEPGSTPGHPRSLLLCCRSDMCNHVDSPEIKIRVNNTFLGSILNSSDTRVFPSVNYSSNEVWFKAATIAVPICGALILFILIAMAVKILRKDGIEHGFIPKHGHLYHPQASGLRRPHEEFYTEMSSKKVPLLLQHHNDNTTNNSGSRNTAGQFEKNEANAKLNYSMGNRQQHEVNLTENLTSDCRANASPESRVASVPVHKPNNTTYRDVNIAVMTRSDSSAECGKYYDKQGLSFCGNVGSPSQV